MSPPPIATQWPGRVLLLLFDVAWVSNADSRRIGRAQASAAPSLPTVKPQIFMQVQQNFQNWDSELPHWTKQEYAKNAQMQVSQNEKNKVLLLLVQKIQGPTRSEKVRKSVNISSCDAKNLTDILCGNLRKVNIEWFRYIFRSQNENGEYAQVLFATIHDGPHFGARF